MLRVWVCVASLERKKFYNTFRYVNFLDCFENVYSLEPLIGMLKTSSFCGKWRLDHLSLRLFKPSLNLFKWKLKVMTMFLTKKIKIRALDKIQVHLREGRQKKATMQVFQTMANYRNWIKFELLSLKWNASL